MHLNNEPANVSQVVDSVEVHALEQLLAEHNVADALQPVFQCREPDFAGHVADEICSNMDSKEVRRFVGITDTALLYGNGLCVCAQPAKLIRLAQRLRSDGGRPMSSASSESVRQHLRTALSMIQDLVIESELGARLKQLQPYIEQTMHDVHLNVPMSSKPAGLPIKGLKVRCKITTHWASCTG